MGWQKIWRGVGKLILGWGWKKANRILNFSDTGSEKRDRIFCVLNHFGHGRVLGTTLPVGQSQILLIMAMGLSVCNIS